MHDVNLETSCQLGSILIDLSDSSIPKETKENYLRSVEEIIDRCDKLKLSINGDEARFVHAVLTDACNEEMANHWRRIGYIDLAQSVEQFMTAGEFLLKLTVM